MTTTAFQIGAFQFSAFQEAAATGGGSWLSWWMLAEIRAQQKKKGLPAAEPTTAEVVETIRNIRARIRTIPPAPPRTASLQPLVDAIRAARDAEEMDEFRAFVELVASDDWETLQ